MKKVKLKIAKILFIAIALIITIQIPQFAVTDNDKIIIQKSERSFIIYYKNICNSEFNFAFSSNKNADESELVFITSVKDEIQKEKLNTAYINEEIYDTYFKDNEDKAYIWIKDADMKYVVKAEEIDLSEEYVMTDEKIDFVKNTSKRITGEEVVNPNETYKKIWTDENNIEHTIILSQYLVHTNEDTNYYYQLEKIPKGDLSSQASTLYNIAEKLKNGIDSKFEQFITQKDFYNLYQELQPGKNDSNWIKLEANGKILEPEDTITGDKYIIWLKAEKGNDVKQDAAFLLCYQEDTEKVVKEVLEEIVKLPRTYESTASIIAFCVIMFLIIVVLVLRHKTNKDKRQNKH